jgi:hypothetical protein
MHAIPWTVVYHNGSRVSALAAHNAEHIAVNYVQSESGVLRSLVSLWLNTDLICAFDNGVERDLTAEEYQQARNA